MTTEPDNLDIARTPMGEPATRILLSMDEDAPTTMLANEVRRTCVERDNALVQRDALQARLDALVAAAEYTHLLLGAASGEDEPWNEGSDGYRALVTIRQALMKDAIRDAEETA